FLVILSTFLRFLSSIFLRNSLVKNIPEDININPERIAIVIPAYNEAETIERVITDSQKYSNHIIVIDDGSTDRTPEILSKLPNTTVLRSRSNQGLGKTMKRGIEYAATLDIDVIITFDADGQYRASEIPKIAHFVISREADLVLGSRFAGKIEKMSRSKKIGNRLMSFALSGILGIKITDGQTGFRGISKDLALSYRLRGEYTYTQEMIIQARFLKQRIIEIPIYFDKRMSGSSRLISSPIDYAWKSWLTILRTLRDFQPIWFFGGFGIVCFLVGLFFFSITTISSLAIPVALDVTIFSTLLLLIGAQLIFFGFLADIQRPIK
ncbi:MAG: glycosyltransferase family 2 protein, partial [Candidatus Thorarchaeota archaeon]